MKVPSNMSEAELLNLIESISNRYAYKFRFGYYDLDDIKQEAFIIALEALDKYDESLPLENFLARHIRNRLITFVRDNYYRKEVHSEAGERLNEMKQAVMNPVSIDSIPDDQLIMEGDFDQVDLCELFDIIDEHLDPKLRESYIKLMHKGDLTQHQRATIINHIKEIVETYAKDFARTDEQCG